jgi:hypothetical protein
MSHLDPRTIDAILDGSLPTSQARELMVHLAQPCAACEQALAEHNIDLEGMLRLCEATEGMADSVAAPLSELERAALWRSVAEDMPVPGAAPAPRPRWRMPAGVAVVLALAAALLLFFRPPPPDEGIKGPDAAVPSPPALELRVVTGREVAGAVELDRRVGDGETLARDLFLLFELEADRVAARYLFVVDGQGDVTQLAPAPGAVPTLEPAGSHRVGGLDGWVVLDLADMDGPLTIVAAAAALPVDASREVMGPWQADEPRGWVAYRTLELELAP